LCAWWGHKNFSEGAFSFTAPSAAAIVGGGIGLLLGLAVCLDHRAVKRPIEEAEPGANFDPQLVVSPASGPPSNGAAFIMLVFPLVAGALTWTQEMREMPARTARLLGYAVILSTALLGYIDMRALALRSRGALSSGSRPASSPVGAFLWILCFW